MDSIGTNEQNYVYWEKQGKDRLCALHCLNSLLQGPCFNESDLATVALELDRQEKSLMFESDTGTATACQPFGAGFSSNVADDGFFNITVLEKCLGNMHIYCIPLDSPKISSRCRDFSQELGFICNLSEHWFALRKLQNVWYNLDSLKPHPTIISEFYLTLFLYTLVSEGYSIFVIRNDANSLPLPSFMQEGLNSNQFYFTKQAVNDFTKATKKNSVTERVSTLKSRGNYDTITLKLAGSAESRLKDFDSLSGTKEYERNKEAEMLEALQNSKKTVQQELCQPVVEPSIDEKWNVFTVIVRLFTPAVLKRRFSGSHTLQHIFQWVEYETSQLDISPPLFMRDSYCILLQLPKRKFRKLRNNGIYLIQDSETLQSNSMDWKGEDLSDKLIRDCGWDTVQKMILHLE